MLLVSITLRSLLLFLPPVPIHLNIGLAPEPVSTKKENENSLQLPIMETIFFHPSVIIITLVTEGLSLIKW
jgi:hypothetical protein